MIKHVFVFHSQYDKWNLLFVKSLKSSISPLLSWHKNDAQTTTPALHPSRHITTPFDCEQCCCRVSSSLMAFENRHNIRALSSLCAPLHSYALACVSAGRVNVRVKYERTWSKPEGWCETDNVAASSCACSIRDGFRGARAPASLAHFPKVTPVFRSPTSFPGRCDV